MKITPRFPDGRPLLAIGYKYNYGQVLVFIANEGSGSTELGDPYLSCLPYIYYNIPVFPVVCPHFLSRYFNACNAIENHNSMPQYDLALDKYRLTQSGYFKLSTTVALGMGITYRKLLYCHGVEEVNVGKKFQYWS